MRMIAIHAQTERKRLDRSVRCAEKRRPWARKQRLRGLIRPDPAVCATAGAACGRKSLSSARIQAIFTSNDTPLGECRFVAAFATIIALPMPVLAHSGGTDSSGCHTNRKTGDYHCHGGGTQRAPAPAPAPFFGGGQGAYENCTAARAAGAAPVYRGDPGYGPHLDRDNDGIGCE